jgi:hypothetical protein
MNLENTDFFLCFHALIDKIGNDDLVNVIVFDSSVEYFWIAQWDIINNPPSNLTSDNGVYWSNITKLASLPVLTVVAIRTIARGGWEVPHCWILAPALQQQISQSNVVV